MDSLETTKFLREIFWNISLRFLRVLNHVLHPQPDAECGFLDAEIIISEGKIQGLHLIVNVITWLSTRKILREIFWNISLRVFWFVRNDAGFLQTEYWWAMLIMCFSEIAAQDTSCAAQWRLAVEPKPPSWLGPHAPRSGLVIPIRFRPLHQENNNISEKSELTENKHFNMIIWAKCSGVFNVCVLLLPKYAS